MRDFTNHQTALNLAGEYITTHSGGFRSSEELAQAFQWLATRHMEELMEEVSKPPAATTATAKTEA
jgi:hypothetical protein